jgi:TolB protein
MTGVHRSVFLAMRGALMATAAVLLVSGCATLPRPIDESTNYTPRWSPDSRTLVFTRRDRPGAPWYLMTVRIDGTPPVALARHPDHDDREPAWSPDGRSIAFDSIRLGNRDVFVMRSDGSGQIRLTTHEAEDMMPYWSPDGTKLVFVSSRSGTRELWWMNADGSEPRQITHGSVRNDVPRPVWSRDGAWIAFASSRLPAETNPQGRRTIYLVRPDGSDLTAVTEPSFEANQRWSPDATHLVFDANPDGTDDSSKGGWEILVMRRDGTGKRRLTRNRVNDWGPDWSPDGQWIAYCSGRDNQYEIHLLSPRGGRSRRVTKLVYP